MQNASLLSYMSRFIWLALPWILLGLHPGFCQTATVIKSTTDSSSYTFSNLSGFSITNNGTITYDGPINQLTGSPCCAEAVLIVNDQTHVFDKERYKRDTGFDAKEEGGNTLSTELDRAAIIPAPGESQIAVQYQINVGGVRGGKAAQSLTIQEKVDGQSMSIFPQFSPTVFP